MADTLVLLRLEHRNFLRVLDVLEGITRGIERGTPFDARLLDQVFEYFLGYPDCCHHPKEDLVLRRLQVRDPDAARRVGDLIDDHEELTALTRRTADRARRAAGRPDPSLAPELRHFSEVYREHLETEERVFFPTAERMLGAEDWEVIDFTMFDQPDPVFDQPAEERYQSLRRAILERADGEPPPSAAESEG